MPGALTYSLYTSKYVVAMPSNVANFPLSCEAPMAQAFIFGKGNVSVYKDM